MLALWACGSPEPAPASATPPSPVAAERLVVVRDHAGEVGQYLTHLARIERSLERAPDAYAPNVEKAALLSTLGRLRGGTADFEASDRAVEIAWKTAPEQAVVRRARAASLQRSHRFEEALAVLEGLDEPGDRAVRAVLGFERGRYEAGVVALRAQVEGERFPDPTTSSRLAGCLWKLGEFDEAETWIAAAQKNYRGRDNWVRAWYHLMLGLMDLDRERLDDALVHYQAAERVFPGWWLVQEHIAEVHRRRGHPELALPIYEATVAETASPELMAALADTLDDLDRGAEADQWRARALQTFERHLEQNPSSAGGHALEFFLEHGDPERALELARGNVSLRPNGEAKLLLGEALEGVGLHGQASQVRGEVRASGWWVDPSVGGG